MFVTCEHFIPRVVIMVVENIVLSLQAGSAGEVSLFKKHDFDY
jgi:hypothetical protein